MKDIKNINEINKELPFRVPDNYFDELPDKVLERCQAEEKQEKRSASLIYILKPAFSLAAMFIGFAIIAYLAVNLTDSSKEKSISNDFAKANYEEQFSSEQEIIDAIDQEDKIKTEEEADEYIDYLLNEEDIDYGTLINELKEKEQDTSKK